MAGKTCDLFDCGHRACGGCGAALAARLMLDDSVDSDAVLGAAMAAGRVTEFAFERRRLTEVFRAAMTGRR